jgi:RNA polymerase sigma-70 factor (ECF subfamily)
VLRITTVDPVLTSRDQWIEAWSNDRDQLMTDAYRDHFAAVKLRASDVCGAETAADVAQEVFLRLWRNPRGFDPAKGSLRTYLVVLARGVALDFVRSDARRRQRDARAHPTTLLPEYTSDAVMVDPILQRETAARVKVALTQLDVRQREAIETSFYEEMKPGDIARQCGIPEGTVKSRVRLGLARLRPSLADLDERGKKKSPLVRTSRSSEDFSIRHRRPCGGIGTVLAITIAGLT